MKNLFKRLAAAGVVALVLSTGASPRAQSVAPVDRKITYILPQYPAFLGLSDGEVAQQVALLRSKIGEGRRVRVGFTIYVGISMVPVDPADTAAVRNALAPTLDTVDRGIALARTAGIPICFSFLTQAREGMDAAQSAAQAADRRTAQWHMDNSIATGWMTLSRYSRKDALLQEAFFRELGRQLAARMILYPDTVVASSGEGEIELASDKTLIADPSFTPETSLLADYSPFAIAEFRDWLRQGGLYATGGPFAGEAYANSSRYADDASPNDVGSDGHSLNMDFGTNFSTWDLKHYDWKLSDSVTSDPKALPLASPFTPLPAQIQFGFDAPRVRITSDAWWKLWGLFRETMVWRHNMSIARWMTTSADPATGATVPADRWFTDQIAADYLFTNVAILPSYPAGLTQPAGFRYDSSASPYWTADVTPYGSMGITSFNVNVGPYLALNNEKVYFRTLAAVAPLIAARNVRWGLFEWNPSVPADTTQAIYDLEMEILEKSRPSVLAPYAWGKIFSDQLIEDTPFETALKDFVNRRNNNVPLTLSKSTLYAQTLIDGSVRTPPQVVRVSGEPGETPAWNASSSSAFIDIVKSADGRSFTVELTPTAYPAGVQAATVVVTPTPGTGYASTMLTVNVTATAPAATAPAVGSFDTPADLQIVAGEVGITGWAVDDVGVKSIDIYRSPVTGEPTQPGLVYLGSASQVEGARPDIEGSFGTIPLSEKAGWGFMLLSNVLPNAGTGIFTLHVFVTDVDGHTTNLGSRRIDCRNASNTAPFGTIDTPRQGETVSGTIVNFGWVLTPNPDDCIPIDGSTIDVFIDNVAVGHPVYNNPRSDIATLFPGLCNSGGAVGYFYIDTTTLTNGVHTIAWVARNTAGGATGMGSRYFTVANP